MLIFLVVIFLLSLLELGAAVYSFRLASSTNTLFPEKHELFQWTVTASSVLFPAAHVRIVFDLPSLSPDTPPELAMHTSAFRKNPSILDIPITPEYCGHFPLRIASVEFFDFFGFWHFRVPPRKLLRENPIYITVMPRIKLFTRATKSYAELIPPMRSTFERAETIGVRPYLPGDDMRNISWKYTARSGELHVKEYEKGVRDVHLIYLDMSNPILTGIEKIIATDRLFCEAADLCAYLLRDQRPVTILCFSPEGDEQCSIASYPGFDAARIFIAQRKYCRSIPEGYKDRLSSLCEIGRNSLSIFSMALVPEPLSFLSRFSGNLATVTLFLFPQDGYEEKTRTVKNYYEELGVRSFLMEKRTNGQKGAAQ